VSGPLESGNCAMVSQIQDRALQGKLVGYIFLLLMAVLAALFFYEGIMIF